MLLPCSTVALAGWSAPRELSVAPSSPYANTAVAVDARGDAAVAWEAVGSWPVQSHGRRCPKTQSTTGCLPVSSVHVAVRTADGRLVNRTLWSSRINPTIHLSVVLGRGQVTVAWGYYNLASNSETARVAYGPLIGRWSPSWAIGHFFDVASQVFVAGKMAFYPQLAVAPNGDVLAAWNACKSSTSASRDCNFNLNPREMVVRWRGPGGGFGKPQLVRGAPLGAVPQFDARGTAYLSSPCIGRILIAPAGSHTFSRSVLIAPGPVLDLSLSLDGAGQGLVAWIAGACSTDPEVAPSTPGPVFVSLLRGGTFAKPQALTPRSTQAISGSAIAVPGGGTVSWDVVAANGVEEPFSAQIGANGLPGATQQGANAVIPIAADGGGDVVLEGGRAANTYGPGAPGPGPLAHMLFVRPAGGGPDQPAPSPRIGGVAAAPGGRAFALTLSASPTTLNLSVWRP